MRKCRANGGSIAEIWGAKGAERNSLRILWPLDILQVPFLRWDPPEQTTPCQPETAPCSQACGTRWAWETETEAGP